MSSSFTKSQIDRLGERLRKSAQPTVEDLEALEKLRVEYDPALVEVVRLLRSELDLSPTSRLKTTGTIIDKLKRERTRLSTMQDVAGVRIVVGGLTEQDDVVAAICSMISENEVIDRREQPNYGYRAVHVVVRVDGRPIEIQVRTALQHRWAQLVEKTADAVGREIRYGGAPSDPSQPLGRTTVGDFVANLLRLSETYRRVDEAFLRLRSIGAPDVREGQIARTRYFDEMRDASSRLEEALQAVLEGLKDLTK